jgi:signal transduction histidine kinase
MPRGSRAPGVAVVHPEADIGIRGSADGGYVATTTTRDGEAPIVEAMDPGRIRPSDLGLTTLLVSAGLVGTGEAAANQGLTAPASAYVLMVAACLPVAVSRRWPAWTAALTGAATVAYVGLGYAYGPIVFALVVAAYRLAAGTPVRQALVGSAALIVASLGAVAARAVAGPPADWSDFVAAAACVAVPAAVGVAMKVRRDATADVRDEQSRRAVSEERLRLAQEVHDVVGHGLAVIAMQAGVALRVLDRDRDPDRVRQALEAIRATSKESLDGVRAELAALREPERPGPRLRPATGLADLPALAARIRAGGLPVAVEIDDAVTGLDLPVEVDRSAYRIVQESLTNVLRHGGPGATVRVRVELDAGALRLEVTDTGRGATPGAMGQGIDGMRARAAALGGSVAAGSLPGGGFSVRARLPVPDRVAAPGERP